MYRWTFDNKAARATRVVVTRRVFKDYTTRYERYLYHVTIQNIIYNLSYNF